MAQRLPLRSILTMRVMSVAGVLVVTYSIWSLYRMPVRSDWLLILILLVSVASYTEVWIPAMRSKVLVADALIYIALFTLNPWAAVVLASIEGLVMSVGKAERLEMAGMNLASRSLAILGGALITEAIFGPLSQFTYGERLSEKFFWALGLLALVIFLIHTLIPLTDLLGQCRQGSTKGWLKDRLWAATSMLLAILTAGLIARAMIASSLYTFAVSVSVFFYAHIAYRRSREEANMRLEKLTHLQLATIESLTIALDAKDPMTHGHIQRVRVLAEGLALATGYPKDQMEGLKAAALLHDIGKLAVPEHILNKQGSLNPAEFSKVMAHPDVAADILSHAQFPAEVVAIVKHHHEKYDGTGYPSKLEGNEIPLGARILTVVDCYDAITSGRPHRPGFSSPEAVELMRREAGRTFDPFLLEEFLARINLLEENLAALGLRPSTLTGVESSTHQMFQKFFGAGEKSPIEKVMQDIGAAQREVLSLYEISQTLGSALKLSEVLTIIAAKLESIANFTTLVIYLAEGGRLRAECVTGRHAEVLKGTEIPIGEGEAGRVAEQRQSFIGGSPLGDLLRPIGRLAADEYRSTAIFPLMREDMLVGALALYSEEQRGYSADEVRLLETISGHVAVAVHNALAFERTRESALTDGLTGLPNARYLYTFFDQERSRAERQSYPLVLMMMDLDGFKKINDTYGHHAGDEVLRQSTHIIRRKLRMGDTLVRYAGDEFIAILQRATPQMVRDLKQRLQAAIERATYEVGPGRVERMGISIGEATYGKDGRTIDEMIKIADQRMYEDKVARKANVSMTHAATHPLPFTH